MEKDFRFGLWERLAVAAFLAGIAGIAVSIAYPLAYPESAISIETWRMVFWGSTTVLGSVVLFFICDLGLQIALWKGARLGTILASIGTIFIVVGAIVGLIGAFKIDHSREEKDTTASPLDDTVQLACEWTQLPTVAPAHPVTELQLNNNFIQAGGVYTFFSQQPNQELKLSNPDAPNYTWRCRFSNFGKTAVLNMTASIHVNFRKVIKTETSASSGEITKSADLVTLPFTLDATTGKLDIYVRNYSDNAYAEILVPNTAQGQLPGSERLHSFKLAPSQFGGFYLPPFERKSTP
jgi:hypothetical protein